MRFKVDEVYFDAPVEPDDIPEELRVSTLGLIHPEGNPVQIIGFRPQGVAELWLTEADPIPCKEMMPEGKMPLPPEGTILNPVGMDPILYRVRIKIPIMSYWLRLDQKGYGDPIVFFVMSKHLNTEHLATEIAVYKEAEELEGK